MSSVVSLCNRALMKIGDTMSVTSLDDDSKAARICKVAYPGVRDQLLQSYPWRFALKLYELAPLADRPAYGYTRAFQMPGECLSVWQAEDERLDYEVVGREIHADTDIFRFKGIRRIEDPGMFDPMFAEALALSLAAEIALPLTGDLNMKTLLFQEVSLFVKAARRASAIEAARATWRISPDWVTARIAGN
nr:MAG TPA: tail tubular protein [Caudoviricetes sp.]